MRIKSFVLIEKENKFLLIQEANKKWKGKWFFPGGGVEEDETPEMGAIREVKEEAGCLVELKSVILVKYHRGFFNKKVAIYYLGQMTEENLKTVPDKESLDVKWFTDQELVKLPLRKNLKEVIEVYKNHSKFTDVEDFKLNDVVPRSFFPWF
jgi:ADP-ribose pyrophosphatase YjhB (NUDIX family)